MRMAIFMFGFIRTLLKDQLSIYNETIKFTLKKFPQSTEAKNICRVLLLSLDTSLRVLAPFMPVLSQHLHARLPLVWDIGKDKSFPKKLNFENDQLEKDVEKVLEVIVAIRRLKKIFNISAKHEREVILVSNNHDFFPKYAQTVRDLSFLSKLEFSDTLPTFLPKNLVKDTSGDVTILLKVPDALRKSLESDLPKMGEKRIKLSKELAKMDKMISGEGYSQKATLAAQEAHQRRVSSIKEQIARINFIQELSKS